jgi:hypothetical protein
VGGEKGRRRKKEDTLNTAREGTMEQMKEPEEESLRQGQGQTSRTCHMKERTYRDGRGDASELDRLETE